MDARLSSADRVGGRRAIRRGHSWRARRSRRIAAAGGKYGRATRCSARSAGRCGGFGRNPFRRRRIPCGTTARKRRTGAGRKLPAAAARHHRRARCRHQSERRRARSSRSPAVSIAQGCTEHSGTPPEPRAAGFLVSAADGPHRRRRRSRADASRHLEFHRENLRARRGRQGTSRAFDLDRWPGTHRDQDFRFHARPLFHRP
jgi:hypothetical protein